MEEWSMGRFITFILIFVIVIIVISYNMSKLGFIFPTTENKEVKPPAIGDMIEKSPNNLESVTASTYADLEKKVEAATKKYIAKYYPNLSVGDNFIVLVKSLIDDNQIGVVKDVKNSFVNCSGYTSVYNTGNSTNYKAYLRCGKNYTTNGYIERNDG